jgi:hypothetical protein
MAAVPSGRASVVFDRYRPDQASGERVPARIV